MDGISGRGPWRSLLPVGKAADRPSGCGKGRPNAQVRVTSTNAAAPHGIDDLPLTRAPVPEPGPGEVLLEVEANTVCDTDLRIVPGARTTGVRPGVIPGYEFAGRVAAVSEGVEGVDVGVQTTCLIVLSCGRCLQCLAGREHLCENLRLFGYEINGGFVEYPLVPRGAVECGNLVFAPHELKPTALALAEPVSCCLSGTRQFRASPGEAIAALGTGPIGLLHVVLAKPAGVTRIVAVGHPGRLDPVLVLGAMYVLASQGEKLTREILDATGGGADAVIVAVGDSVPTNQALEVAAIGGRVNYFVGLPKGSTAVMESNIVHYRELQVTGGPNACRADVRRAVELLSSDALDVDSLVTHRFLPTQADVAITVVRERADPKVVVALD